MEVMSWGGNEHGQLGSMNKENRSKAYYVYEDEYESILSDVISVAAGDTHSLALTKDGYVYAWGGNEHGQLGIGYAGEDVIYPTRVLKGDSASDREYLSNIIAIEAGNAYSLALRNDGTVFAWGEVSNGKLGTVILLHKYGKVNQILTHGIWKM